MSRILFAWELGAGFGHLGPFRPIAERLVARGHEVTVAGSDVQRGHAIFSSRAVKIVQAPVCARTYEGLAEPPLNYSEILMRFGYLDAPLLSGLVRAWQGLLDLSGANVLVADHAPTALLAARGRDVARAAFGNPFTVPPPISPMPSMRSWVEVPKERLAGSDASVLKVINESLPPDAPRLGAVHEIFDGAARFYTGVPETDPYGPRAPGDYLGLYTGMIASGVPAWPAGEGPRIFVYLHADYRHIDAALSALGASGARCLVYLLGATPALRQKHEGPRLVFSTAPVDLDAVMAGADLCVCQANMGTMASALRAGKPMVLAPGQLEQFLVANALGKLGLARVVYSETHAPDIAGALAAGLGDPALARAAREFALRHREPSVDTIADTAASRIEALARERTE